MIPDCSHNCKLNYLKIIDAIFFFFVSIFFFEKYRASILPGCFVGYIREEFSVSFISLWPNSGAVPRDNFQWMFITHTIFYHDGILYFRPRLFKRSIALYTG